MERRAWWRSGQKSHRADRTRIWGEAVTRRFLNLMEEAEPAAVKTPRFESRVEFASFASEELLVLAGARNLRWRSTHLPDRCSELPTTTASIPTKAPSALATSRVYTALGQDDGDIFIVPNANPAADRVVRLQGISACVNTCALSPSDRLLMASGADERFCLWSHKESGLPVHTIQLPLGETGLVSACFGSADHQLLLCSKHVRLADTRMFARDNFMRMVVHTYGLQVTGPARRVFDKQRGVFRREFQGHLNEKMRGALFYDANTVLTASDEGIKLWSVSGTGLQTLSGCQHGTALPVMPCVASGLVVGICGQDLAVWSAHTGDELGCDDEYAPAGCLGSMGLGTPRHVAASPSGALIAVTDLVDDLTLLDAGGDVRVSE
eukprot:m.247253 g.247253  ORF g.247253 m.247253 type:complete len:380 (+) comp49334_c0_seq1:103-1242(+)